MSKIKTFLGTQLDIRLIESRFSDHTAPQFTRFNDAKFVRFEWKYIGDLTRQDPRINNEGVRANMNTGSSPEEIAHDYEINNWDVNCFPPVIGTDGEWREGRSRVIGALLKGQDYIPVAVFDFHDDNNHTSHLVGDGLRANASHKVAVRPLMEDYIVGGIKVIESDELERDPDAIMEWLTNVARIDLCFSSDSGIWTKVRNSIMDRTASENELMNVLSREDWESWMVAAGYNPQKYLLYKATTGSSSHKFWTSQVLENGGQPRPVILYTTSYSPIKASNEVKTFVNNLKEFHLQTWAYVNESQKKLYNTMFTTIPTDVPFEILGVVPNMRKGNQPIMYRQHKLVSVEDYINDGCSITQVLQAAE